MKFMQEMIELSTKQPQDGKSITDFICCIFFALHFACLLIDMHRLAYLYNNLGDVVAVIIRLFD